MAVGDVISDIQSVAAGSFLSMQPASGVEWVIHNVGFETSAELYFFDGTNGVKVDSESGGGSWRKEALHCTNSKYYRVKNTDTVARVLSYDGVQTK